MNQMVPDRETKSRAEAALGLFAPSLYADHVKVYPRAVSGRFRTVKWGVLIACLAAYYIGPWLRWDRGPNTPDQALLLDMAGRRGYFFNIEIWPQEVYYITGLLILGAVALFLATALFGRIWCGYACPQTVWTDLFMLVERWVEGDRNARMKLDQQPLSFNKVWRKTAKHVLWVAIAAATGGAWIMYFQDAPTVTREMVTGEAGGGTYFFFGLFTGTTYLLAGWAREQVCTYMCPWPRFQAAMLDEHSLAVTYQGWRGETRGKHKAGDSWDGRGDCVDCRACVNVCPTGIDIRDGLQLECIGCGLCIDACDEVMGKVGRPLRLIDFVSDVNVARRAGGQPAIRKLVRARTVIYAALLVLVAAVMVVTLATRSQWSMNVLHDRAPLYVTLSDGSLRNGYTVKVLNKTRDVRDLHLALDGLPQAAMFYAGDGSEAAVSLPLEAAADDVDDVRVFVKVPRSVIRAASTPFHFRLLDGRGHELAHYAATFNGPN
ncbi:cytochrome c oxidase accessory protein CcoG [Ferrovibrio xuzhouensis]|uniref:Cytochrome c oxidase accessory protein CcoG n=1 Tax=Ferrovibrio xuzhouensis TaxID=1576914 RepID=A0ABV7VBQ8_9PROT